MTDTSRRPRLILLTQWFDPEPTMKGMRFAERMDELGFDVEVVTGFPNYPAGKVYSGYRIRPMQRQRDGNVTVTRLALYPSHDSSRIGRILNYVSFFLSAAIYLTLVARKADVMYAYHPPLTTGMAAIVARMFRRMPVVLDIQDFWPDTLRATGMISNERILGVVDRICRWTYRRADRIVVLSNGFRRLLIDRGVRETKISVIYNWADEPPAGDVSLDKAATLGKPGSFKVLFAGNMGRAQGLDSVLDAANMLCTMRPDIEFCFLGDGLELERLRTRAMREKLDNVRFLPRVPLAEVGGYLAAADCLLVHLSADPLFEITIPSKTQAYLAAGRPLIMAVAGDAAELVRRADGGVAVPPQQPRALAEAVVGLASLPKGELARMGRNSRAFYLDELSFEEGTRMFASLLLSTAGKQDKVATC